MAGASSNNSQRPTALDFATHNVWGDALTPDERNECVDTLRELVEAFGTAEILRAVAELGITAATTQPEGNEQVLRALRAFCVLIEDSDKPKLTGRLVGKLCRWELATGHKISYRQLARDWGTSKQAVHNRAKIYRVKLGLPSDDSTPQARENHRLMNKRNYG